MEPMHELLQKTSRTFALAIPLLPEPTRATVSLAYLLFRVADTLEDAGSWTRDARVRALISFGDLLRSPDQKRANALRDDWLLFPPSRHQGYLDLLSAIPDLAARLDALSDEARQLIVTHALRTEEGMRHTLARADEMGRVRFTTLEELKNYCYVVAGIVGELVTELFVLDAPELESERAALVSHQVAFGEGLQLVNILRDAERDAVEGRMYLPRAVPVDHVMALAREDLARAKVYIDALARGGAPAGFLAFASFPAQLADASLLRIASQGAGARVSRAEVMQMFARYRRLAFGVAEPAHSASAQSGK